MDSEKLVLLKNEGKVIYLKTKHSLLIKMNIKALKKISVGYSRVLMKTT